MNAKNSVFSLVLALMATSISCNKEKDTNARSRPSDESETIPQYLSEDRTTIRRGNGGRVDVGDASVSIPTGALDMDVTLRIRRVDDRSSIFAEEIRLSAAAAFDVSIISEQTGEVLSDDDLSTVIKISQNVTDLSDRTQLQMAYATTASEAEKTELASLIANDELEIEDAPAVAGVELVSVSASIARTSFVFTVPDYERVANRIATKSGGMSNGNPVGADGTSILEVGIATNVSSEDGSVYYAKNAFTAGRIRLRPISDVASKVTSNVLLGASQGLQVNTYSDDKFTIKLDSALPGLITLSEETSKLDTSKAEIAYVTDLGLATQKIQVIPNSKLIFEPKSDGTTTIKFSVNESNFTTFLIQTEPSNSDRQKWGEYSYASTPRDFTARSTTTDSISLEWEAGVGTPVATGFVIGYNESSTEPQTCTSAENVLLVGNDVAKTISGLKSATTYSFMICSKNGSAFSPIGPSQKYRVKSNVGYSITVTRATSEGSDLGMYIKSPESSTYTYQRIATVTAGTIAIARASGSNGKEVFFTFNDDGSYLRNKVYYGSIANGFAEDASFTSLNVAAQNNGASVKIALTSHATGNIRILLRVGTELRLYSNASGTFSYERVDTGQPLANIYFDMVIDRNDHVHVLYHSFAGSLDDLTYKKKTSTAWVNEVNFRSTSSLSACHSGYGDFVMRNNDQDIDPQHLNFVHIVRKCKTSANNTGNFLYTNNKNGVWATEIPIEVAGTPDILASGMVDMNLGYDNSPHVMIMSTSNWHYLTKLNGSTFENPSLIGAAHNCIIGWNHFSLDTKSNNNVHMIVGCNTVLSLVTDADGFFTKTPFTTLSNMDSGHRLFSVIGERVRSNN
jgi:hypothetical protein